MLARSGARGSCTPSRSCSNGTEAFELLLRLPDDNGDLIPPGTFLYNAERFGLIEQIDRWVLRQAVGHLSASHAAGIDVMLSVNVSVRTIGDRTLGEYVAALLAEHPVRPHRLVIEITETAAITNIERARGLPQELQALGCLIALDDFGAGFASFYYLKHLEFDFLKIDGEFIRNLCSTPAEQVGDKVGAVIPGPRRSARSSRRAARRRRAARSSASGSPGGGRCCAAPRVPCRA